MPVIRFRIFNPLIFSLLLNLLTKNVSVPHHKNAPASIETIPVIDKNNVVSLFIKSKRAKRAISTKSTSGFENVSPNDEI